jgi:hypothetical protein
MSFSTGADGVLQALRAQHADLARDAEQARARLTEVEWKLDNLGEAIAALERMQSPVLNSASADEPPTRLELRGDGEVVAHFPPLRVWGSDEPLDISVPRNKTASEPVHPAIAPYVGGTGQRLRSTSMVADLLASTDESFTRDELKALFFTTYPREELEKFWEKPDNAFGNALARAVEERLVSKGKRNGTTEIFLSRAAYDRLVDDWSAAETASSDTEVEEER